MRGGGSPDITLVNPRPKFVERIRLHQHAAGNYEATVDYGTLLGGGIKLVVDTATRIDTANRTVELASGSALDYDYVIYAVGSTGAVPASVPGAAEFAYPIAELEQAQRLRADLEGLPPNAPVTVVGAGLTGIETAAELAERGRNVTLVCGGQMAPTFSEPGRRSVVKTLRKLGVKMLETDTVTEVRGDAVPELAANSGLHTDELGRLHTDETLTSVDDHRIVAAGDCASPSGAPLRMCCASASQLGPQAANTVLSRIAGTTPAVFEYALPGTCTSLGRRAGILQLGHKDDTPVNVFIGGRLGARVKEAICRGTVWGLRREARKPGSSFWFKGGPRPAEFAPEVVTKA
jgi:NADH dehydrogenase